MKTKNLILLAATFLLLIVVLWARSAAPALWPQSSPYLQKIRSVDRQKITQIEISRNTTSLILENGGSGWKLNNKKVGAGKAESLLQNIFAAVAPEVVAQTDMRHKELELTADLAAKIKLGDRLTILIGKYNSPGFFVRFDNDNMVYLLKDLTAGQLSTNPQDWLDKTVVAVDPAKVKGLTFTQNGQAFSLSNKDGKWQTADGKDSLKDKTDALVASLATLTADAVVIDEATAKAYGPSPTMNLLLTLESTSETLGIFKGPNNYLIRRGSDGEQFIISAALLSKILSAPKDLSSWD